MVCSWGKRMRTRETYKLRGHGAGLRVDEWGVVCHEVFFDQCVQLQS